MKPVLISMCLVLLCCLLFCCTQEREYVVKSGRTLVPTPLGRLLTAYLTSHFSEYVDVNFTAKVEEQLDEVSGE
jgi:DNA topoisomerase IA